MDNKDLKSKDCLNFLIDELKKELIGPSDGLFNRPTYKKEDDGNYKEVGTPSLSVNFDNPNLHRQEVLVNSPKYNYIAGVLYPQKTSYEETTSEGLEDEENITEDIDFLDDTKTEKNKNQESEISENSFDHDQPDNDEPIDLTNELKPSAMGLSVSIKIPDNLIVSLKNIGQYYKVGTKETIPEEARIVGFFISKFNNDNKYSYRWISEKYSLENSNRKTCEEFIAQVFNIKSNSMKNIVDYFDKFFDSREGWKNKLSVVNDVIKDKYEKLNQAEFEKKITELVNKFSKQNNEKDKYYEGYFRKSINSNIEFNKDELLKGCQKNFLDEDGNEFGLSMHVENRDNNEKNYNYLTFHLVNNNESNDKDLTKDIFFQCNFEIHEKNNKPIFHEYNEKNLKYMDEEELSLHLLHRNFKSFAIGHGCSASWKVENGKCIKVFTEIFPSHEIKPIKAKQFEELDLDMGKFSLDIKYSITQLRKLIHKYNDWLKNEDTKSSTFDELLQKISKSNVNKAKEISKRIEEGIEILEKDKNAQEAFMFMNKAMLQQQFHYTLSTEEDFKFQGKLKNINYADEIKNIKIGDKIIKKGKWYPFQISFIIMNIKSFIDPLSKDRDIMDLIWFPTGGGKTEAYLGLSAFVIFLRKIINPNSYGNAVIMRYTLRLLTTQQFLRASTLICACEKIRSENENKLGKLNIDIGLWIGGEATPNKIENANYLFDNLQTRFDLENKFLLINCPWCGTDMGPKPDPQNEKKRITPGYRKENKKFVFACENEECNFSHKNNKILPITVVDEMIYKKSPDLIVGTIDKFAMLPWRQEAIDCFGNKNGKTSTDLIIQDEFHLISGPLGSMAGMFEISINALTEKRINNKIINAKIVGSTATISRAEKQITSIYARNGSIFPPQTNQLEDSFFSHENKDLDGRKYVGIFCQSSTSPQITLSKVVASLLVNTKVFSKKCGDNFKIYDPYWTQLIYFNSIRELMSGATLMYDDVKEEKDALYIRKGLDEKIQGNYDYYRNLNPNQVSELTSNQDSSQIPKILKRLFVSKSSEKSYPLDICLATNMIQVGIDIPRLSLMIINGQPKTTSEYIQASSRVGREQNSPGLVFNIMSPFKPRDRSHYEHFKSYHNSIYNHVEPTSVTPHSDAVRKRCLHSVIITLSRLWDNNLKDKPNLPNRDTQKRIIEYVTKYVEKADPDHKEEIDRTLKEINKIFLKWESTMPKKYGSPDPDQSPKGSLMCPPNIEKEIVDNQFLTPLNMRNVDNECSARISKTIRGVRD